MNATVNVAAKVAVKVGVKNKKFSLLFTMILCALITQVKAQAQEATTPAPETTWEADPLDVLDKKPSEAAAPENAAPEFKELPAPEEKPAKKTQAKNKKRKSKKTRTSEVAGGDVSQGSDPDFHKEAEFNRIYRKYNEQPTSIEAWERAVASRKSETYQVQKGNTLWDISNTFFGDPNYWPKIWSLNNGAIGNPHEISPEMNIRFFAGNMNEAPTVEIGEKKATKDNELVAKNEEPAAENTSEKSASKAEEVAAESSLPGRKKKIRPPQNIPDSLPPLHLSVVPGKIPPLEMQLKPHVKTVGLEYLSHYLTETPVQGVGVVTATEMDLKSVGDYVYIYVRLDQPGGKNFVVQKNATQISGRNHKASMIEIQGAIEIVAPVNAEKNIYRALVKKSIAPVEIGSILVPGELPMIDPSVAPISPAATAHIIGGQYGNRTMFGANSLVFVDAGSQQGLQEGQSLGIYANESVRISHANALINDRQIGILKVIKVSDNFATAYVTKSTDDIQKGDYVGESLRSSVGESDLSEAPKTSKAELGADEGLSLDQNNEQNPKQDEAPVSPSNSGTDDLDLEL